VPPLELASFCAERLAYFKVPRYWAYRDDLPRTPSERVRKGVLRAEADDPRVGAYDRVDEVWR
jgi:crotonobetaine/carnitine-CoA ligase